MLNLGKGTTHHVNGKVWKTGKLTVDVINGFREWVAEQIGDPFKTIKELRDIFTSFDPELQKQMIGEATALRKQLGEDFSMTCELAQKFMSNERGSSKLFQLLLLEHHPEATENDALAILLTMKKEDVVKVINQAAGELPKNGVAAVLS